MRLRTFACVITAPLGKPVDPEVNMMYAGFDPVTLRVSMRLSAFSLGLLRLFFSTNSIESSEATAARSVSASNTRGRQVERILRRRSVGLSGSSITYGQPSFRLASIDAKVTTDFFPEIET